MNDDLYYLVLETLLDEAEINEFSGVGAIGGVATQPGPIPSGKVKYRSGKSKSNSAYKKKSKNKKTKSPSWYLKNGPAKKRLQEQNATKCLTTGAQFHTYIDNRDVGINVDLPFDLNIDEYEASHLETLLHNAVEMVLRPYFKKDKEFRKKMHSIRSSGRKVIAFDYHGTLVDVMSDKNVYPRIEMINKLIQYMNSGAYIVIYTAAPESDREKITGELRQLNIPYDMLEMDKPEFDIMYDNRFVGPYQDWV